MPARLEVHGLTIELPTTNGWVRPVADVSFALNDGESLGVVGESGSGKTMLALALMGLTPPGARASGSAILRGAVGMIEGAKETGDLDLVTCSLAQKRAIRGRGIAMIFQEPMTALNPVVRIGEQIEEAIRLHEPRLDRDAVQRRALKSLDLTAVPEPALRARQYPHQLSGGLRQRVMIAMALAAGPKVLIADEPTTALDVTVQKQILELLSRLRKELSLSVLFITHDLGVVSQIADRTLVMYAGRIVEEGRTADVLRSPRHPYTQGLLRAAPRLTRQKLEPIPGNVPALDALPAGCAFGPRCGQHIADCDLGVPGFRTAGPEHDARCILVK